MITRRKFFSGAAALIGASSLARRIASGAQTLASPSPGATNYHPVVTPNGSTLPWIMKDGVKEFHLTAEPVKREFAPECLSIAGVTTASRLVPRSKRSKAIESESSSQTSWPNQLPFTGMALSCLTEWMALVV
jgi:hypothetical protein